LKKRPLTSTQNNLLEIIIDLIMLKKIKSLTASFLLIFSVALLSSCGGGSSVGGSSNPSISRMIVIGDSLEDSGTFGHKFTHQGSIATGKGSFNVYSDVVAENLGIDTLCNYYIGTPDNVFDATFTINSNGASCTNYAVGGGRIIYRNADSTLKPTDPRNLALQITHAASNYGSYSSTDLILVGAAGNDFSDLISAALSALTSSGIEQTAAIANFGNFVSVLVPEAIVNATLASVVDSATLSTALANLGIAYSSGLATLLNENIKNGILQLGASKVIVKSAAPLTATPRFSVVLGGIEASLGTSTRQALESLFDNYVVSFNTTLESLNVNESRTTFYNVYDIIQDFVTNPSTYGFVNSTNPSCPPIGFSAAGIPVYNAKDCSVEAAIATVGSNYASYVFSTDFNATPLGHSEAGKVLISQIQDKAW